MQLEVGKIYEGKVTGITKFGAFVELDKDTTGMVHISEVANTFVSEIKEHIKEGDVVKVKVLTLGDDGKIGLSIKKAIPMPPRKPRPEGGFRQNNGGGNFNNNGGGNFRNNNNGGGNGNFRSNGGGNRQGNNGGGFRHGGNSGGFNKRPFEKEQPDYTKAPPQMFNQKNSGDNDFEDMLNKFKATSEEKFTDLKHVIDNKRKSPSRRK